MRPGTRPRVCITITSSKANVSGCWLGGKLGQESVRDAGCLGCGAKIVDAEDVGAAEDGGHVCGQGGIEPASCGVC